MIYSSHTIFANIHNVYSYRTRYTVNECTPIHIEFKIEEHFCINHVFSIWINLHNQVSKVESPFFFLCAYIKYHHFRTKATIITNYILLDAFSPSTKKKKNIILNVKIKVDMSHCLLCYSFCSSYYCTAKYYFSATINNYYYSKHIVKRLNTVLQTASCILLFNCTQYNGIGHAPICMFIKMVQLPLLIY